MPGPRVPILYGSDGNTPVAYRNQDEAERGERAIAFLVELFGSFEGFGPALWWPTPEQIRKEPGMARPEVIHGRMMSAIVETLGPEELRKRCLVRWKLDIAIDDVTPQAPPSAPAVAPEDPDVDPLDVH